MDKLSYAFALQFLLNDDTLRTDIPSTNFSQIPCNTVSRIPIVVEYAAKGEEAFLSYFFDIPYCKDWSFLKNQELFLRQFSRNEWVAFKSAIINQLYMWRFYSCPLHSAEGRLHCNKVFVPPPYSREP